MKHVKFIRQQAGCCILLAALWGTGACMSEQHQLESGDPVPILINGRLDTVSKNHDQGFQQGDCIGLYVVNYQPNMAAGTLADTGNHGSNVPYTYDEAGGTWRIKDANGLYWKDFTTHADFFAYYPYTETGAAPVHPFHVAENQDLSDDAYGQSDFLWSRALDIAPQWSPVNLVFRHVMSKIQITVDDSALDENDRGTVSVSVLNTYTYGAVDLYDGSVSVDTTRGRHDVRMHRNPSGFSAIVFPQTVSTDCALIAISVNGKTYTHYGRMTYESGKVYQIVVALQKTSIQVFVNQVSAWEEPGPMYRVDAWWSGDTVQDTTTAPPDTTQSVPPSGESADVQRDRANLMVLYQALDGEHWKDNTNWGTDNPLSTWKGISVTAAGRVKIIALINNGLNGVIPSAIGRFDELTSLKISNNHLSGSLPDSLFALSKLETLWLYDNQISGPLSSSVGNLTKIQSVQIQNNNLIGSLPGTIGSLNKLSTFKVSGNRFSGVVPGSIVQHAKWESWNPDVNILPQQEGYGLTVE